MIRNGVIDATREFAERRYVADVNRRFDAIKADARRLHGVDIEPCRATYLKSAGRLFAVVDALLVSTHESPPRTEPWADAKRRHGIDPQP